jgi:hypothetical protein
MVLAADVRDDAFVDHWRPIGFGDLDLKVDVIGTGQTVVIIQTALNADELRPLAEQAARHGGYQVITITAAGTPAARRCCSRVRWPPR